MGWLHYTERETLDTSLPALEAALDAFVEGKALETAGRFGVIGGGTPTQVPTRASPETEMAIFRSAARAPKGAP